MDLRSAIRSVVSERAPVIPPGFSPGADESDSSEMLPSPAAVIDAESLNGVRLALLYEDCTGAQSRRVVQVKSIQSRGDTRYIYGHCELRSASRSFRIDRIVEVVDMRTGEVSGDPEAYLAPLLRLAQPAGAPRRRDATDGLLVESVHGLIVLLYFASSDGEIHPAERKILWDYLDWQKERCSIRGSVARKPINALLRTMFPTGEQFAEALEALLAAERIHAEFVLDMVREIIDADGVLDEEEVRRWQQLLDLLRARGFIH